MKNMVTAINNNSLCFQHKCLRNTMPYSMAAGLHLVYFVEIYLRIVRIRKKGQ